MKTPRSRISSTIADKTLSKGSSKQLGREIAAYLIAERRTDELESILRDVQADWAAAGYVEVVASSSYALSADAKTAILAAVKPLYPAAKQIFITEVLDPALIGGVQISVANQQLDLSIEAKLDKFKQLTGAGKE